MFISFLRLRYVRFVKWAITVLLLPANGRVKSEKGESFRAAYLKIGENNFLFQMENATKMQF